MLGLVLGALWRRRGQSGLLLLLAAVAAAGAAAAPGYVAESGRSLAAAAVVDAAPADRVVAVRAERELSPDVGGDLTAFTDRVAAELALPGFTSVAGAAMVAVLASEIHRIAYRDNVCAHLSIDGSCPDAPGEVLMAAALADRLGVAVGDRVPVRGRTERPPVPMTVVGRFQPLDPFDPYWGRAADASGGERLAGAVLLTPLATFAQLRPNRVELTLDLAATPRAVRDSDPQRLALAVDRGAAGLGTDVRVDSSLRPLVERLLAEQRLVYTGVGVAVGELLVICWLALFLALRQTGEERRADIRVLKMRGAHRPGSRAPAGPIGGAGRLCLRGRGGDGAGRRVGGARVAAHR